MFNPLGEAHFAVHQSEQSEERPVLVSQTMAAAFRWQEAVSGKSRMYNSQPLSLKDLQLHDYSPNLPDRHESTEPIAIKSVKTSKKSFPGQPAQEMHN